MTRTESLDRTRERRRDAAAVTGAVVLPLAALAGSGAPAVSLLLDLVVWTRQVRGRTA